MNDPSPNKAERAFLELAYSRFFELFDEVMHDSFWEQNSSVRLAKVSNAFAIYAELLNYTPIKHVIEEIKRKRPPMEGEISSDLFKFIRNLLAHFPVFREWNEVWFSETIVNWERKGTIHKFLLQYKGRDSVKYRMWNPKVKEFTYVSINFPSQYQDDHKIYLKDLIEEKEGIRFSFVLMNQVMTQIEPS